MEEIPPPQRRVDSPLVSGDARLFAFATGRRQRVPRAPAEIVDALRRRDPVPEGAVRRLAAQRLEITGELLLRPPWM